MTHEVEDLAQIARRLRSFLQQNKTEQRVRFPGFWQFPENSCEGASCLLTSVFEELGLEDVVMIEGYDRPANAHHFWVESGGRIYDLTADQFPGLQPVFGAELAPSHDRFAIRERVSERRYFDRAETSALIRGGLLDR